MFSTELPEDGFLDKNRKWNFLLLVCGVMSALAALNVIFGTTLAWVGWTILGFFAPGIIVSEIQLHRPRHRSQHKDGFVVKRSAWTAISYMLLCSGWFLAAMNIGLHRPDAGLVVNPFLFICAAGLLVSLYKFLDPAPMVVINDSGYFDRNLDVGTIPWKQISGARIVNTQGTDVLSLQFKDPTILQARKDQVSTWKQTAEEMVDFELLHLGLVELDADYIDQALDYVLSRCGGEDEPQHPDSEQGDAGLELLSELGK